MDQYIMPPQDHNQISKQTKHQLILNETKINRITSAQRQLLKPTPVTASQVMQRQEEYRDNLGHQNAFLSSLIHDL